MITSKILSNEYENLKIASLPTNPTADVNYGGYGYSASQMKAAFDALPLLIIEKHNKLIDEIIAEPGKSISGEIKTGIANNHTLYDLFADIKNGNASAYFMVGSENLASALTSIQERLRKLEEKI